MRQIFSHFYLKRLNAIRYYNIIPLIMRTILLPGGIGYIGSHTLLALLPLIKDKPYRVHIFDDLSNSSTDILPKLKQISVD